MAHTQTAAAQFSNSQAVLLAVAEQLKLPLLQLARQAELSRMQGNIDMHGLARMQATADRALGLLDAYALAVRLQLESENLAIEPVSISSVLYDAAHQLEQHAQQYGVNLELHLAGKYGTVMAHRAGLEAALVSLGLSLIEALPAQESPQLRLQLATHRCRYGLVAGLYADADKLTSEVLRQGRSLHGHSRQPLQAVTHTAAAGVFVADALFAAMDLELKASRHQKLYGLGAVLQPNYQLQMV